MFKLADGSTYRGQTKFNGLRSPAWNKFEQMRTGLPMKLAKAFRSKVSAGTDVLLIGVGSGSAAFEAQYAHCLALLGFNVQVVCIDPSKICIFTPGVDYTKVPFIEPTYAHVSEFVKDRAKYSAPITIMTMIWPNPHDVQLKEGTYDMEAVELIKPNYMVTMYSTSVNNISGTVQYSADMVKRDALYKLSFKGLVTDLAIERITLIENLCKIVKVTDKKCDLHTYGIKILKPLRYKEVISEIWYDEIMKEVIEYIKMCYTYDVNEILKIIVNKLEDFKQVILIDAELKLIAF